MGVDFYACHICGETFADCGDYITCGNCDNLIGPCCMDGQETKYGRISENHEKFDWYEDYALNSCDKCAKVVVEQTPIAIYLAGLLGMTWEEAVDKWRTDPKQNLG